MFLSGLFLALFILPAKMIDEKQVMMTIQKILALKRLRYGLYKYPKVLKIDADQQILNTYIDDEPKFEEAVVPGNEIELKNTTELASIACYDQFGTPFPGFLCPLMKIMAHQYGSWRSKMADNMTCEMLMDLSAHPCNHNTSSCVLLALSNSHLILGCMDDHTGKFIAPQKWAGNSSTYASYLLDFRVDNPFRLTQHCRKWKNGKPVCMRNNLFYRQYPILQQLTCCCKGDFCVDALFDQAGFNPMPFVHVSAALKFD